MRRFTTLLAVLGIGCIGPATQAQNLSTYGTPGLIDMPTAEVLPDGYLTATTAMFKSTMRNTLTFQMLPRVYGSFRYTYLPGFFPNGDSTYDRSFDVHFQVQDETSRRPGIAVGLRDFGGTGIYSSEYVVLTKTFADRWKVTGGMGWGRLAGRNNFKNPLAYLNSDFEKRPTGTVGPGGQLSTGQWFRGPAALFGGVEYQHSERLSFLAEYSSDVYTRESRFAGIDTDFPLNFGASYKFKNGVGLSGYVMYGSTLGLQLSYSHDPRKAAAPGGLEPAAPALRAAEQVALASWNLPEGQTGGHSVTDVLRSKLSDQGLRLVGFQSEQGRAVIEIENDRYHAAPQAIGRAARVMANTLAPTVTDFQILLRRNGLPITAVELKRSDLYELENDLEGAWRTLARTEISDGISELSTGSIDGAYPHYTYRFAPYTRFSFFDPDSPIRYEVGAEIVASYTALPGLTFSTQIRQPVVTTLDDTVRTSDSVLPHVRSDWALYAQQSDLQINSLTGEYLWRPGEDLFARVTGGYLEEMFGGVSAELLWFPSDSRFAWGGEINYARQRDFDMLLGFQGYDVITGHASMYYNAPGNYNFQVDAGRYLAGDWGATFSLDREFNNGFKVGAFFTLTNVSASEFGEGSFDKGIRLEIPLSLISGRESKAKYNQIIRPILRDGGARLNVANRLYGYTREERAGRLIGQWGRFYR